MMNKYDLVFEKQKDMIEYVFCKVHLPECCPCPFIQDLIWLLSDSYDTVGFQSIEIAKKEFLTFDSIFHAYLMRGYQKYGKN